VLLPLLLTMPNMQPTDGGRALAALLAMFMQNAYA